MEKKENINLIDKRDRLNKGIAYLKGIQAIKTQKDISDTKIISESSLTRALKPDEKYLTDNFLRKFAEKFNFNDKWFLTGEGEMLNKADDNENSNDKEGMEVLLLPVSAEGGRLDNFSTQVLAEDCETVISPIKGVDFAMTVTGDSMFPEYPSGSRVLVKKINEKAFIDWGRVYVLDTCNGTVIKKIMPSEYEGKIRCESINPEYPPFEVCFDDVFGMYRVLMCMSLK